MAATFDFAGTLSPSPVRARRSQRASEWCTSTSSWRRPLRSRRTSFSGAEPMKSLDRIDRGRAERETAELSRALRPRPRPSRDRWHVAGGTEATGRDSEGALSRRANPHPRRADRGLTPQETRELFVDHASACRAWTVDHLHHAQAARSSGRLGPDFGHATWPDHRDRAEQGRHRPAFGEPHGRPIRLLRVDKTKAHPSEANLRRWNASPPSAIAEKLRSVTCPSPSGPARSWASPGFRGTGRTNLSSALRACADRS